MTRVRVLVVTVLLGMCGSAAAGEEGLFPFVVSYDTPANATNVSAWLDRPAGVHGFIRAEDGHFRNDVGPVRFWATNIAFEGCFPTHQQAERLAARLARLGINCVRMHHMDSYSIWGNSPNKLTIDPRKLERLDYLIGQLKKHGVYTNLNLHVSRWFGEAEGFSGRSQRPEYDKGLDNFEPRMIELQKKYAHDLLEHVNPYTGNPYTREPAIAFVEINNENALHATWGWGQIDRLPEPYASTFRTLWNGWLKQKYGNTEQLRKAWNGVLGLGPAQRLEDSSIPVLKKGSINLTSTARHDFADFLWDTEAQYWWGMHRFLKNELGVKSLVAGTQIGWSPAHVQAALDYVDGHAYWQHPVFPGRPWDSRDWYVNDLALVNQAGGTLSQPGIDAGCGQAVHRQRVQPPPAAHSRRRGLSHDRRLRSVSGLERDLLVRLHGRQPLRAGQARRILRHQERPGPPGPHAGLRVLFSAATSPPRGRLSWLPCLSRPNAASSASRGVPGR